MKHANLVLYVTDNIERIHGQQCTRKNILRVKIQNLVNSMTFKIIST